MLDQRRPSSPQRLTDVIDGIASNLFAEQPQRLDAADTADGKTDSTAFAESDWRASRGRRGYWRRSLRACMEHDLWILAFATDPNAAAALLADQRP